MADQYILGLVEEATPTADILDALRKLGVPEERMSVMSGIPYSPQMLGRAAHYERLGLFAAMGALGGLATALLFTVGTPLLYPLYVGGQPLVPGPPTLIVCFELTMLGTMLGTFAGLLAELRFPFFRRSLYDPRITAGHIGILVRVDERIGDEVVAALSQFEAQHIQRQRADAPDRMPSLIPRVIFVGVLLVVPVTLLMALAFSFFNIPLPNQMVDQPSVGHEQGPRLAAPVNAVPVQGPVFIAGQPARPKTPATAASVAHGQEIYNSTCIMCHGKTGEGNGTLAAYFNPKPANLTSAQVQNLSDNELFTTITNGFNQMPPQAEGLFASERWDVVNFLRTLKK